MTEPLQTRNWFVGGGEMGDRIRSFDWSQTSLGAIESWSQSLRSLVKTLLASRYPMVLTWGPNYTQFYNDAYSELIGDKHPAALGLDIRITLAESWDTLGVMIEQVMRSGIANWTPALLLVMQRSGYREESYFSVSHAPAEDDSGEIVGMLAVCSEVTQQILGERRLRLLRDLSAKASDVQSVEAICQDVMATLAQSPIDVPFALLYLQDSEGQALRLQGAVGLPGGETMSPHWVNLGADHTLWSLDKVAMGETVLVEEINRHVTVLGGLMNEPVKSALVLPIASSGQKAPLGVLVAGVSPNRALDESYRSFYELLASQVSVLIRNAQAYEEERQRAEALAELDRAKTDFFSNVSHEFRTPLTLMLGPIEAMLNDRYAPLPPHQQEQLKVVDRNAQRLLKLVNTLLDFSRIEAGRIQANYEPTDLATYTAELASVFRSAIESAGIQFVVDCSPLPELIYVDREMWEKIILNLLSNAFKFTFEGTIAVRLTAISAKRNSEGTDNAVQLTICDTGTGIPTEALPHLFERFYRIRNAQGRSHEGSGIGLSLVQELVQLHGGQIEVSSAINQGTTFTLTLLTGCAHLPADQVSSSAALPSTAIRADAYVEEALRWLPKESGQVDTGKSESVLASSPRILLADDNTDMRDYVKRLLEERYTVEAVSDGLAALAAIRDRIPDLVLTDVMMPQMDGFELLQTLRSDPEARAIPIILLSARAGEESQVEGLEAGADDYLVKPFSARELLARVDANIRLGQMRREATLRQLNETLEQRVQERTAQLEAANKELDAFSHSVSHDLRAPLRRINGLIHLLQDELAIEDPNIADYIALITQTTQEADALIEDLLSFSRMARTNLCQMRFSMTELLKPIQAQLQRELKARSLEWQISPLPEVYGDPVMLKLVWQNLLSNAVKYTRSRPYAQIIITSIETEHEQIFSVQDNGVGFDMNRAERLFGIFQRLHDADEFEGTGIGLANVQRIIHRHGGRVWANAELDRGATFYFSLPKVSIESGV